MSDIIALFGSPRRGGNTALLLQQAVAGARETGATVEEIYLRDLKISPCLEIYQCIKTGQCAIKDDFPAILARLQKARGIMLASPIFFYTVSAHTKIFMDRCQSVWVNKYWREKTAFGDWPVKRKGLFISVGATGGKRLFDGALLTVKYFFDVLDTKLDQTLLCRNLDHKGEVRSHPDYLAAAKSAGADQARAIRDLPVPADG
ncbi:MAG: flavodoxin family protein [Desulfosarcinaceae bacterium]